jgi:nicotinate phosphoribosyltransferase
MNSPMTEQRDPAGAPGSLAILTDLYELTMAYGYWKRKMLDTEAVFHLTFRNNPFNGGYAIAGGLAPALEALEAFRFDSDDLEYLGGLRGNDDQPLFEEAFLDYLLDLRLACDVDAIPEGTPVFAHEPLLRVTGPILHAQILETLLLNLINFQTLIATKASRVVRAAKGDRVVEFGLRRAQGIDGGLAASRAAYLGGCSGTSNVLAGKKYGIPVNGTLAHSWVMAFDSELESFEAYAEAMGNNVILLVDTYDTLQGVRNAVEVGRKLRERGHRLAGIRLDSGDLAWLSKAARAILDDAGFPDTIIAASNEFDEYVVESLKQQGATITLWGVGTRLVTGHDQAALGGIYKLSAVRRPGEPWQRRIKLSDHVSKTSNPGILQVRRYSRGETLLGDMIYDTESSPGDAPLMIDPLDVTRRKRLPADAEWEDLLIGVVRGGKRIYDPPPLEESRARAFRELDRLDDGIRRFLNPHEYPVGLEENLHRRKTELILSRKRNGSKES